MASGRPVHGRAVVPCRADHRVAPFFSIRFSRRWNSGADARNEQEKEASSPAAARSALDPAGQLRAAAVRPGRHYYDLRKDADAIEVISRQIAQAPSGKAEVCLWMLDGDLMGSLR